MKKKDVKKAIFIAIIVLLLMAVLWTLHNKFGLFDYPKDEGTIIGQFHQYHDEFAKVQQYAYETEGLLYVTSWRNKVYDIENTGGEWVNDSLVEETINNVISKLHFKGIHESKDGTLRFIKAGGSIERGIMFSLNKQLSSFALNAEDLGNGWYYYEMIHE